MSQRIADPWSVPRPEALPSARLRGHLLAGGAVLLLFFGGAVTWAAMAPLSGAAVAPAAVLADGHRRTVQHREGGIIRRILVRNGDSVQADQPLVELDDTATRAQRDVLASQRDALLALRARLEAERDGAAALSLPPSEQVRLRQPGFATQVAAQAALLRERRTQFEGALAVMRQQMVQLQEQITGGEAQLAGIDRQRQLIEEEVGALRGLLRQALVPRPRVLALDRNAAALDAERGRVQADIARARTAIGETELRMAQLRQQQLTEVIDGLRDAADRLATVEPQLRTAADVLARSTIRAPISGDVVGLAVFTRGGVLAPGSRVLDVVPHGGPLLFEARLRPEDKSRVATGMAAEIRLSGIADTRDPVLRGGITTISADRLTDPATQQGYYAMEVQVDAASAGNAPTLAQIRVQPGMPATVTIATEPRTALDYLIGPLRDRLGRAFREE